jgi:hypothetical protein
MGRRRWFGAACAGPLPAIIKTRLNFGDVKRVGAIALANASNR